MIFRVERCSLFLFRIVTFCGTFMLTNTDTWTDIVFVNRHTFGSPFLFWFWFSGFEKDVECSRYGPKWTRAIQYFGNSRKRCYRSSANGLRIFQTRNSLKESQSSKRIDGNDWFPMFYWFFCIWFEKQISCQNSMHCYWWVSFYSKMRRKMSKTWDCGYKNLGCRAKMVSKMWFPCSAGVLQRTILLV